MEQASPGFSVAPSSPSAASLTLSRMSLRDSAEVEVEAALVTLVTVSADREKQRGRNPIG